MLGGDPKLSSAESSWFFRRYSNTSHRRRVQNKERSSPLAIRTFPPFTSLRPFATVCRGWQGYRAWIISVSPHDFVPQPIEATACLSYRDWLRHRGVADGADRGDGIAGVPRAGVCAAGADRVAGGWVSGRAGAGVGVGCDAVGHRENAGRNRN